MDSRVQLMIAADHLQRDIAAAQDARRAASAQRSASKPPRRRGWSWGRARRTHAARTAS